MKFDTEMTVNLTEIKKFVESKKFTQFLLNNTTDFSVAAFVLQALLDRIEAEEKKLDI